MACPQSVARSVFVLALAAFPVGANASVATAQEATCLGLRATIIGTGGDDTVYGTHGDDVIVAGPGNDTVYGLAGNDVICGGDGNDGIYGGPGSDVIYGAAGDDALHGDGERDSLRGGPGHDRLHGGEDADDLAEKRAPQALSPASTSLEDSRTVAAGSRPNRRGSTAIQARLNSGSGRG